MKTLRQMSAPCAHKVDETAGEEGCERTMPRDLKKGAHVPMLQYHHQLKRMRSQVQVVQWGTGSDLLLFVALSFTPLHNFPWLLSCAR